MFVSSKTNMSIFQQLEVVGRGSETHFQVGENVNKITCWLACCCTNL